MFKIFNTSQLVMEKQFSKEISKPAAREILKERIGQEEFKAVNPFWKARIDANEAAKNSRQYKKDYERTLPETLSSQVQNQMWKRAKQLKDEFIVGMLSRDELHPVKGFMENGTMKYVVDEEILRFNHSVDRESAWLRKNEIKIKEYKNIMRHLNPNDPNAGDIEKFRVRNRGVK